MNTRIRTSLFTLALVTGAHAQEHSLVYDWLNTPCSEILSCDVGCSACNVPEGNDAVLYGTNAAFVGVETCPLPVEVGDNAIYSSGWPFVPTADRTVIISGIATVPVHIDSVIFVHSYYDDGPRRLRIEFTNDAANPATLVTDVEIPADLGKVILTDLGDVSVHSGGAMGTFQLRFTAYDGNIGAWVLDKVRIVASASTAGQVGIAEIQPQTLGTRGPWFDLLGRPISARPAPGAYINAAGRMRVF